MCLLGKKDEEITANEILAYDKLEKYGLFANSAVIHNEYSELAPVIIYAIRKSPRHKSFIILLRHTIQATSHLSSDKQDRTNVFSLIIEQMHTFQHTFENSLDTPFGIV